MRSTASFRRKPAWLPALALLAAFAPPAHAQSGSPSSAFLPTFVEPALFPGLRPVPPDRFGLSPTGDSIVFFDDDRLILIRVSDAEVIFERRFFDLPRIGFSVDGDTLVIQTLEFAGRSEVLLVDTFFGIELGRFRFLEPSQVLVSRFGNGFLIMAGRRVGTELLLVNDFGDLVFRRSAGPLAQVGFGLDAIALVETSRLSLSSVRLLSIGSGRTLFRQTVGFPFRLGFNPTGDRFVLATTAFRFGEVRLLRTSDGATLLLRSVRGLLFLGFTPGGEILAIVSQPLGRTMLELFSALDGRPLLRR